MAQGLPVITTPNCGAVVTNGEDGFIVPACDAAAFADDFAARPSGMNLRVVAGAVLAYVHDGFLTHVLLHFVRRVYLGRYLGLVGAGTSVQIICFKRVFDP